MSIYKSIICILFVATSCKPKKIVNKNYTLNDVRKIELDLNKYFYKKKTGIFIYPNLGTVVSLRNSKFNGEMSIVDNKDTLFYCVYKNNKPVGKYINEIPNEGRKSRYIRILPLKPKLDVGFGRGTFNQMHQKDGFWLEKNGFGNYVNGLKNGEWQNYYSNDVGGRITKTTTIYKNDIVLSVKTVEERHGGTETTGLAPKISNNMGLYNKQNQKEGYWEEDNRRYGEYINGLKNGVWTDYNVIQGKIIKTTIVYKNDTIVSTATEEF